ncbi:uncharacterized protein BO96DRAFT_413662 [Aspergillus niger CBS 101883]|uniref:uncharacterized protein n=1 Tax=Aspergillus lacticoffeatus (strain CBS 101883) TaxID=1450533 RepID=UPI000D7F571F|nr:uncharacterized protein BO96DRAFT_413662 [Aspergillus niger CBS 101883]PYH54991.1 hypothetical protein BO96DRAFT_413662 [Aspergillus niger CBS 101883]
MAAMVHTLPLPSQSPMKLLRSMCFLICATVQLADIIAAGPSKLRNMFTEVM